MHVCRGLDNSVLFYCLHFGANVTFASYAGDVYSRGDGTALSMLCGTASSNSDQGYSAAAERTLDDTLTLTNGAIP